MNGKHSGVGVDKAIPITQSQESETIRENAPALPRKEIGLWPRGARSSQKLNS
ncbi:hypothetical protein [Moorena sp. SIO4G3]|uniref:hypothetical protein n=1 Tax=Moorena sp. SIO4G3 TaxID=2607821 RepID=UPI0025D120D1|nr:hypothetical protein [Moorena sp. SIO4G3]